MTAKSTNNSPYAAGKVAFFAGSFDPFTVGHASIVDRALPLFDSIVIAIGINMAKPSAAESAVERRRIIADLYRDEPRVSVVTYDGLTSDAALRAGASCLLRGVRSVKDFEYECDMADINRKLSGLETVLIYSLPEHAAISSSVVRELQSFGKDISDFIPKSKD